MRGVAILAMSLAAFIVAMLASRAAMAQAESQIEISAFAQPHICEVADLTPGPRTFYVFHTFNAGIVSSRFKVESGPGMTMTYISETHPYAMTLGNTQSGISVCYGPCELG